MYKYNAVRMYMEEILNQLFSHYSQRDSHFRSASRFVGTKGLKWLAFLVPTM